MYSEAKTIILRVVENYFLTGNVNDEQVKVTSLAHGQTSYVEHIGVDGRSIMLDEFRKNGKVIWAGYSSRSGTVYVSLTNTATT